VVVVVVVVETAVVDGEKDEGEASSRGDFAGPGDG
jgi:hypothetical protein